MDEEDGQVLPYEAEAERKARAEAIENYEMDKELAAMKNGNNCCSLVILFFHFSR